MTDMINEPPHYRKHPSGIECIEVTEHMNFNLGNVIKYVWRADEKGCATEDLEKARWYLTREIQRRHENNPAVYCIRCGIPHLASHQCLRENGWRPRETESRDAVLKVADTIAEACQLIDQLTGSNES